MSICEYKGHTIHVWVHKLGTKRYDWSVKAGKLPTRRNSGECADSEAVAASEAFESACRELDQTSQKDHG